MTANQKKDLVKEFIEFLDERIENHRENHRSAIERMNLDHAGSIDAARNEDEHVRAAFCRIFGLNESS